MIRFCTVAALQGSFQSLDGGGRSQSTECIIAFSAFTKDNNKRTTKHVHRRREHWKKLSKSIVYWKQLENKHCSKKQERKTNSLELLLRFVSLFVFLLLSHSPHTLVLLFSHASFERNKPKGNQEKVSKLVFVAIFLLLFLVPLKKCSKLFVSPARKQFSQQTNTHAKRVSEREQEKEVKESQTQFIYDLSLEVASNGRFQSDDDSMKGRDCENWWMKRSIHRFLLPLMWSPLFIQSDECVLCVLMRTSCTFKHYESTLPLHHLARWLRFN